MYAHFRKEKVWITILILDSSRHHEINASYLWTCKTTSGSQNVALASRHLSVRRTTDEAIFFGRLSLSLYI